MRKRIFFASLAFVCFCLLITSVTQAQVNISSGGASYFWDPANPQTTQFNDPVAGNIMFEDHWIIRSEDGSGVGVQTRVFSLNGGFVANGVRYMGTTNMGDTAVSTWDIWGAAPLHRVTITHTISTASCGAAILDYQVDVTNIATNAINGRPGSPVSIFNFFDYDIDVFSSNSATASFDGDDVLVQMSGDAGNAFRRGLGADRHELRAVGVGNRITTDILASTSYNLDNDPTELTNVDVTAAMQWDFSMPALGATTSFSGTTEVECQGGPAPVLPDSFKLADGVLVSGTLADLLASDDMYFSVDPSPTKNLLKQRVDLIVQSVSPTMTPGSFSFRVESAMTGGPPGDVIQTVELFNYMTNNRELVDTRPVQNTDESVEITPGGDPSRFVNQLNGEITAIVIWKSESFAGGQFTWSLDIDETVWFITE